MGASLERLRAMAASLPNTPVSPPTPAPAPAFLDTKAICEALMPSLLAGARRDAQNAVEHVLGGVRKTLEAHQIQCYQAVWTRMTPVLKLVTALQEKMDDQKLGLAQEMSGLQISVPSKHSPPLRASRDLESADMDRSMSMSISSVGSSQPDFVSDTTNI